VTVDFAYSCVVTISPVKTGDVFSYQNVWCKRPGTGQIKAKDFTNVLGKKASNDVPCDVHLKWSDVSSSTQ
jgi:N-acetylneuraminate synthase